MPKYTLNGKTYNIPDSLTQKFESENPSATIAYSANGKNYNIPVDKRDAFLKAFPDAKIGEQAQTQPQSPQQPVQVEAQPKSTEQAAVVQQPQQQKPNEPYKPTELERMAMGMTIGSAQNTLDNLTTGIEQQEKAAKNASPVGDGTAGLVHNNKLRKGKQRFNAESGQFEDTYMTTDGRTFNDIGKADNAQGYIDYLGDRGRYLDNMKALGLEGITGEQDKTIDQRLKEAYSERLQLQQKIAQAQKKGLGIRFKNDPVLGMVEDAEASGNPELFNLNSALRLVDRRITALEAERDDAGFVSGTWDVLKDPSTYSFGLTDLADSSNIGNLMQKVEQAKQTGGLPNLTDSEKLLAKNYLMNQEAQALNENRDWWYTAGQGFGQTLSFMKDFAITGGGFANIAKVGMRMGTKQGLKYAGSDMAKFLTKNLGTAGNVINKTIQYGAKYGGLIAGTEIGGALQANTVQLASTVSDIMNRHHGAMTIDKEGKLDFKDAQDLTKSILFGELNMSGENASELVGPAFDLLPGLTGRILKNKLGQKWLQKLASNKYWRGGEKTLDFLGVQSVFGEGMEEEYGMARTAILNALTGGEFEPNAPSITDVSEHLNTWAITGLTSGLLRAPQMMAAGYNQAAHYGYKYNLNGSDRNMREVFGDMGRYNSVKAMLDGADNGQITAVVNNLMRNAELSKEEKEAMFFYANDLIKLRGYNIGNVVAAANGYKEPPRVSAYQVKGDGRSFDELDAKGNVLAHHEFKTNDEMKTALYEMQQQRFDHSLQSDIGVLKARPDNQFETLVNDYCLNYGVDYDMMMEALNKPSMERSEMEQQMVAPLADLIHNTVYDNTMLHEEQSQQDGEDLADADSIDLEEDSQQGIKLKAQWDQAQANRQQLFEKNEDLMQEVENMEKKEKLSPQEILSRIESSARPDEVQAMIDYYNTKAKYEGYINRKAQKIDEEAANSRARHTFKGTIDGKADLGNVYTITDGTNEYYLVSGNITTDPTTGRITGSTSGLIIGMDLDGSFVQLNESDGYSVMPVTQSLDQFEEAERIRLQEQVSATINPNAAAQVQQSGNVGGENPPATAPVAETQQPTPQQPQQPAVTIESVTDNDGVKRYENGISAEDAIADMLASNDDPTEIADASIAEAEAAIKKINDKPTKTRKDLEDRKKHQKVKDYYEELKSSFVHEDRRDGTSYTRIGDRVIISKNGKVLYDTKGIIAAVPPSSVNLGPEYADATPFIQQLNAATSKKKADEILNQALQAGVNPAEIQPVHTQKVSDLITKEEEARRQANEITDKDILLVRQYKGTPEGRAWLLDRKRVPSAEKRRKLAKLIYEDLFDDDFEAWSDERELISLWLSKDRALDPDSFGSELNWDMGVGKDAAKVSTMFTAKRENGGDGMLFSDFVHMVAEASGGRFDTEQIRNTLIRMFQEAQEKSDLAEYQLTTRVAQAEKDLREQEQRDADAAEDEELEEGEPGDTGQLPFAPATGDTTIDPFAPRWTLSDKTAKNGEQFYQNANGEIDLVDIPQEVFDKINYTKAPFRLTVSMAKHVFEQHTKELHLQSIDDAIDFVIDVMTNFDHVRLGDNGSLIFSVENGRKTAGKRAITILLSSDSGDYYGIKTSGFEEISRLKKRPLLWDGSAEVNPSTDTATEPVTSRDAQQGGEQSGSASGQSGLSNGKDNENSDTLQENQQENALTIEEINNSSFPKQTKTLAKAFLEGRNKSEFAETAYNDIYEEVRGSLPTAPSEPAQPQEPATPQKPITTADPIEAINKAAASAINEGQNQTPKQPSTPTTPPAGQTETLEQKRARLKAEILAKAEALKKEQLKNMREDMGKMGANRLTPSFIPRDKNQRKMFWDLVQTTAEYGYTYIQEGVTTFNEWKNKVVDDVVNLMKDIFEWTQEQVDQYVDAVWNSEVEADGRTQTLAEFAAEKQKNAKEGDNSVNEHKQEDNEAEKPVSLQQEELSEEEKEGRFKFVNGVSTRLAKAAEENGEKPFKSIVDLRKFAQACGMEVDMEGMTDILLQELVEDALVKAARKITQAGWGDPLDRKMFEEICRLYELQPTISQRSSNRIKMQQYSTPLPMAFVADKFIASKGIVNGTVLEPTAGNGMLVIGINPKNVHANELDKTRLANLEGQKFKKVTNQDATQPFEGNEQYDAVIANPPFGSAEAKEYDGKLIPGLAEQIALNALSKMKDNGKAVIIIGENMQYADNGAIKSQKAFFTYLYDHYNVKGVVDMDGSLYAKQGTTYPTRMIIIDGRRSEEERAQTKVYPPVKENAPKKATTFGELFDIVEEISNDNRKTNGNEVLRTSGPADVSNSSNTQRKTDTQRRTGQSDANGGNGQPRNTGRTGGSTTTRTNEPGAVQQPTGVVSGQNGTGGLSTVSQQSSPANRGETGTNNGVGSNVGAAGRVQPTGAGTVQADGRRNEGVEEKRELSSDKLPYRPHNGAFSLESVAPAAMVEAMDKTLQQIEKEFGNIDNFVTSELGYDSVEDMHNALAAEQVDSVAMAIWNMKNGEGMVIGDQTGVGKGRQMAALIRWAVRQGKKPIFVTKDADLFSDIYRDLVDIGSGELRPFIFNAGVTITDANGRVVHKSLPDTTQKRVLAMDELPDGFDFAILSYPQMNTGDAISQEEAGKKAKESGERAKKGKAVKAGKPTPKADFLRRIAKDNYLLMDESQNAAGSGNTGAYFQSILKDAKAVTFASATFAKRPDTMPLYAIRTAISKAKVKAEELISMIGKGGVTLQEIMSRAMTGAGQMVRRERDMSDVVTDWKTIDDPETAQKARRDYDNVMQAFNAIIDFQNDWIRPALARKSAEFAGMAGTVTERKGTKNAGVDNPPFVNRLYNFSKQLLLSLKVDAVVNEVIKEIEAGHKPVIALENTLESALDEYGVGETIDDPTLFGKLKKGLDATFRYTLKDEDGNEMGGELQPHELGPEGEQAYNDLVELIQESTQGMFISPLDAITEKLEQKGVKVGEISGRKTRAVLNDNGEYEVTKRENTDRKKLARDFNSGELDCLIINKTGSTGISLHASKRFTDQRPRTMIMAQPLSDINDYMQMIGRIDRTGQVHRGYYINLGLPVPAETRFMMMLANKLKSLNANTTTSQENKDNEVDAPDLLNKYGDQVMIEYLRDNPDVYRKLGEFLKGKSEPGAQTVKAEQLDEYKPKEGDARQITGRVALLSVDEQDAFYDDVTRRYNELIKYLNDTGSNDLKITVMPLRARTIAKGVSSEGTAPNSGNPFADNAYVEWVEMDILKKPMKAAEVGKTIEQLNPEIENEKEVRERNMKRGFLDRQGSKTPGRIHQIYDTIERETEEKMRKENERYEAAKAKAEQDIAERTDAINKQEKRTKEQKEEAIKKYADEKRQAVEDSHNNMVNKIEANRMRFEKALRMFEVGDSVLIPDDLTTDAFLGSVNGIFCGFKAKNDGVTQSTTLAVFCTLDGRRKIEVKVSDTLALARINRMTEENWDAAHQVTLSNWDSQIPTSSRKRGYIMTGNILQAIADSKQGESFVGQLVTFTDEQGNVRDGILMPDKWEPSQLKGATVPIASRKEVIKTVEPKTPIVSSDGRVTLTHYGMHNQWGYYYLDVPKSKKQGGEFYLDRGLLDLVDGGEFFTKSGNMRGRVPEANIDAVIDRLGQMGVTLPSDSKVELETVTEEHKDESINTQLSSDPMDAINQAANSWRRSVKESESSLSQSSQVAESENKSVPLERRTMKSYTDRKGVYHEGIEDELARIESEISAAVNQGDNQDVLESQQEASARPRVNDLRKQAAKLRAEIARRNQKKQELRKKYNIDERGNISLDDLVRMFRDLNSNKAVGKLFDKVVKVLKKLNVSYRFTDNLDAMTAGEAGAFYNTTFYNWDVLVRDGKDQTKAGDLLHEMIHNVAEHILMRYENPALQDIFGKLSPELDKAAQEIKAIFKAVRAAKLKKPNGKPYYGSTFASEMIAELADEDFRKALDTVAYNRDKENSHRTAWQAIKEWFRKLFGVNTALDSLGDVLDNILDSYSPANVRTYNREREIMEQRTIDEGRTGDYMDYLEAEAINGRASLVEDADLIERLEKEPKIKVYRAMQLKDGKLYPPMAAKVNGQWQDPLPLGKWSQADEHPELVDKNGKFTLDKGNGKTVAGVVYAPYMHGSTTMLNDQFKEAQDRPELVVVEAEMPESELTSGYQAEKSPRKTGRLPWKAGTIQGQLTGMRDVILSRWVKPVRIVPASEVAQSIKQMIDGQVEIMPTNVVTPEQREELEKLGVKFVKTNNQEIVQEGEHKGEQYSDAYGKKSKKSKAKRKKSVDGDPLEAISRSAAAWRKSVADDEGMTPEAHSAKAVYDERLNRVETVFSEAYQDAMVSLKTAQNAIAGDKDIPDSQNAYMAENLMHGKNKNEMDLYNREKRDPLIRTINKIMNLTGMNWGDIDRYVYTKSGLERNREFFVRDWLEAERNKTIRRYEDLNDAEQDIYDAMAATIEDMFEDGDITEEEKEKKLKQALQKAHQRFVDDVESRYQQLKSEKYQDLKYGMITFPEYLEEIDRFIRWEIDGSYVPEEHDYSGFRAMFGDEDGKYDEADIIDELMNTEGMMEAENVDTLWEQIREATRYGLERYREAGMRSDEQIDRVEQMFNFYVPMRGFKEETGEDMYQYFTGKAKAKSYVGGLLKHAKGRGSEANYPISTIFAMTYKAISDCNQNLVNQKFYRLCQANPNDLVILSDSWAVYDDIEGVWKEVAPIIPEEATEDEVREITLVWEEGMKELAKDGKAKKINGKEQFDYKPMDKRNQSEHIVDVRINGQPRKMIVTGNPRMAQALNGQLRFEHGKNKFSKWNAAIKNFMASVFTSYSPTFALRNMFRDWTHFRTMLGVREGHGYASQANKYYRQSLFKMVGLFKKYREGTLDESKEMERDFKDFMDNGGITGFVFMQKIDDIQKEMESLHKSQKKGKTIRLNNNLWEKILGAVEALNEGIENNARFATYRASRHYAGRTKARSAYDAKEITVNFNRKGAGGKTAGFKSQNKKVEDAAKAFGVTSQILGEGKIFFNATVQAIATTFKNFQNADGSLNKPYIARWAAKYALPPFMFGMALPIINKTLAAAFGGDGDDDPYANLPEWTRRKNLCFYIGNNNFITIPIGQELAVFLTLGDIFAGYTYAPELKPIDRDFTDEMVEVMNTFSPVDVSTKITKGGLMEDPVDEVIGRTFSVLAPLVAVGQNLGWTGRPIYREDKFQNDPYTPEYQMVYQSTNPVLVNASKLLHELGGGDDITRGKDWSEVNPATVQYLWEQYTGGPGKVFSNIISIGKDAKDILTGNESDFNVRKVEGLKAFVQQGDDRTAYYRTQAKYRKYKEDAERLYDAVKGYEDAAETDPMAIMRLNQIDRTDYLRMEIVREADNTLSKINKAANKAEGKDKKELRKLYNEQVREVVNLLDSVGE